MGRRAKPVKVNGEARRPPARKSTQGERAEVRDPEKRLEEALTREAEAFGQLQTRNRELGEAREQQAATSEILRVISSSPTDAQPVFDAIVRNAVRLCGAVYGSVNRFDGEHVHFIAHHNYTTDQLDAWRRRFPRPLGEAGATGRVIIAGRPWRVDDVTEAPEGFSAEGRADLLARGARSVLIVPMSDHDRVIGTINLSHRDVGAFTDAHVELLETFADQAVIAIENVRLFNETKEALERQTATSEILRVISSSLTDTQPVFDTIAVHAARLCTATDAQVLRVEGNVLRLVSASGSPSMPTVRSISRGHAVGRAVIDRQTIHVRDMAQAVGEFPETSAPQHGVKSVLAVPLLRTDVAVGVIRVSRTQVQPFTDAQITLLQTFADQAVIAIENARLLTELQARTAQLSRSVDELTALGDVGRVLSSTRDLETVLQTIVTRANQLTGTAGCTFWEYDPSREEFRLRVSHYADVADAALLQTVGRVIMMRKGHGVTTQVFERRQPVQIRDIAAAGADESPIHQPLIEAGHRALLGVPLLGGDAVIGVLAVTRKTPGEFEPEIVRLLSTFATQSALAIQNARLFLEIEDKSRQLEAASQHKSEFLANMSHELRTPLNAIIGFSEVLTERMFGELNEKQDEYLKDIYASGQHLLLLINDILDLSKIEAGRMELEPSDFEVPGAIDDALTLVRERAGRRGITLGRAIDERVGVIRADERKVKQVLLNLLSNALKFTLEGGRIEVRAAVNDELVEVSVTDTGVGIAPEDQEAVFEEFRQVGTADRKVEGTGLGLALSRKFIELHGGRIWVTSQLGAGSTFTFTIPVRREPSDRGDAVPH